MTDANRGPPEPRRRKPAPALAATPPRRLQGVALAFALAPLVYAFARIVEARMSPEQDPAAVIWSERSAMQGRLTVVAFAVMVVMPGTLALTARVPDAAPRLIAGAAWVSLAALLVQAWVWP